ncbi:hypothetical protein D4764_0275520 [Takifugu flavidus]|uniref:Uncharacterized protein n=1 Tax=Takifugu flavidus TaxID=433684 RepID=A0A5C6MHE9_9TELE|nr:hypothetical protein D4764_0275520 [Takifugu flavidus]
MAAFEFPMLPSHLSADTTLQNLLQQDYHCVSAWMGIPYFSVPEQKPQVLDRPSPPALRFSPKVVVTGPVRMSHPCNPLDWTTVTTDSKIYLPVAEAKDISIELNPVWFSTDILAAVEAVSPSHLPYPVLVPLAEGIEVSCSTFVWRTLNC